MQKIIQETKENEPVPEMSLEQGFARLEELTEKMESGDLTLEEMYSLYREGLEIVKVCSGKIDTVEKNMLLMDAEGKVTEFS